MLPGKRDFYRYCKAWRSARHIYVNKEFWQQFQNYAPPSLRVIRTNVARIARTIYIFVPWFVQTDQSDCSIRGVYISYTPPKRVYIFCLRSRPPISRYAAKKPKRFRSKVNKVIIGRNNKVNFTSKSYMTAGRISERILEISC